MRQCPDFFFGIASSHVDEEQRERERDSVLAVPFSLLVAIRNKEREHTGFVSKVARSNVAHTD